MQKLAAAAAIGFQKAKPYLVGGISSQAFSRTTGKLLGDDVKFKRLLENQNLLLESYEDLDNNLSCLSSKITGLKKTLSEENEGYYNALNAQLSSYSLSIESNLSALRTQIHRVQSDQMESVDQLKTIHRNLAGGFEDLKQKAEQIDRDFQEKWDEYYIHQLKAAGSQLSHCSDVIDLKQQLEQQEKQFGLNDPRTKTTAFSLEETINKLKEKEQAFTNQLNNFNQVKNIITIAANFVDSEFSNHFNQLASAGIEIYKGLEAITSQGTIVLAGGPLAPYVAIASGIQLIMGLFQDSDDDGLSNALTAIMDGLQSLSKQIERGFNHILKDIRKLYPQLCIMQHYILTIEQQQEKNQNENRVEFERLKQQITALRDTLVSGSKALALQPARTALTGLNIHREIRENQARQAFNEKRFEIISHLKKEFKRPEKAKFKIDNTTYKYLLIYQLQADTLSLEVTREIKDNSTDRICLKDTVTYNLSLSEFIHELPRNLTKLHANIKADLVDKLQTPSIGEQPDNLSPQSI